MTFGKQVKDTDTVIWRGDTFNAAQDALRRLTRGNQKLDPLGRSEVRVQVKNTTGQDADPFSLFRLTSPIPNPQSEELGFKYQHLFRIAPAYSIDDPLVIIQDPIPNGHIGTGIVAGYSTLNVTAVKTWHGHAIPDPFNPGRALSTSEETRIKLLTPLYKLGPDNWTKCILFNTLREIFPVTMQQTGGEPGSDTTQCTFTYTVRNDRDEIIAEEYNPTAAPNAYRRPPTGELLPGTRALATRLLGVDLVMVEFHEPCAAGCCSCDDQFGYGYGYGDPDPDPDGDGYGYGCPDYPRSSVVIQETDIRCTQDGCTEIWERPVRITLDECGMLSRDAVEWELQDTCCCDCSDPDPYGYGDPDPPTKPDPCHGVWTWEDRIETPQGEHQDSRLSSVLTINKRTAGMDEIVTFTWEVTNHGGSDITNQTWEYGSAAEWGLDSVSVPEGTKPVIPAGGTWTVTVESHWSGVAELHPAKHYFDLVIPLVGHGTKAQVSSTWYHCSDDGIPDGGGEV